MLRFFFIPNPFTVLFRNEVPLGSGKVPWISLELFLFYQSTCRRGRNILHRGSAGGNFPVFGDIKVREVPTCWNHIKMHLASSKSTLVGPRNQQRLPFICRYYGKHIAHSSLSVNKEQRRLKYIFAAILQGQCVNIFSRHYPPLDNQ